LLIFALRREDQSSLRMTISSDVSIHHSSLDEISSG
jgi:hypothetical protein